MGESEINNPWTGVRAFHIILFGICESGGSEFYHQSSLKLSRLLLGGGRGGAGRRTLVPPSPITPTFSNSFLYNLKNA